MKHQINGAIITPEGLEVIKMLQEDEGLDYVVESISDTLFKYVDHEIIDPAEILKAVSDLRFIKSKLKILSNTGENE